MNASPKLSVTRTNRSPSYPSVDLATTVERAKAVFKTVGRHPTGVEVIASAWGYKPTSSTFKMNLAATRAFGFLEDLSSGKDRLVKLSQAALDIVEDFPESAPERWEAIKKAALRPRIYTDLWDKYEARLPADDEIKRFLVRDKKFADKAVAEMLPKYKATIAFARLAQSKPALHGATDDCRTGQLTGIKGAEGASPRNIAPDKLPELPVHSAPQEERFWDLAEGQVVVRYPKGLSSDSFDEFQHFLNLIAMRAKRSIQNSVGESAK